MQAGRVPRARLGVCMWQGACRRGSSRRGTRAADPRGSGPHTVITGTHSFHSFQHVLMRICIVSVYRNRVCWKIFTDADSGTDMGSSVRHALSVATSNAWRVQTCGFGPRWRPEPAASIYDDKPSSECVSAATLGQASKQLEVSMISRADSLRVPLCSPQPLALIAPSKRRLPYVCVCGPRCTAACLHNLSRCRHDTRLRGRGSLPRRRDDGDVRLRREGEEREESRASRASVTLTPPASPVRPAGRLGPVRVFSRGPVRPARPVSSFNKPGSALRWSSAPPPPIIIHRQAARAPFSSRPPRWSRERFSAAPAPAAAR